MGVFCVLVFWLMLAWLVGGGEAYNEWLRVAVCMRSRHTISVEVLL